jgi:ABC-type lipoprotein release transport system permease subunit
MLVLIRIAWRNLREHSSKSLIIGTLVILGVIVIVVGNSLLDSAEQGVHRMFIDNYTGDVFISGIPKTRSASVSLFGLTGAGESETTTPVMPHFDEVRAHLEADGRVKGITSQLSGEGLVTVEGNDNRVMAILFGVDPETYPRLFHETFLVEGSYLKPGVEGMVVSRGWLSNAEKTLKTRLGVGDKVVINTFGRAGFKIREATIVGVVDFSAETQGMDMIVWANADTVRILSGVDVSAEDVVLSKEQTALLNAGGEDEIFAAPESTVEAAHARTPAVDPSTANAPSAAPSSAGSWHFLLARLKDPGQTTRFINDTNAWLASQGIAAKADGWKAAAGPFAQSIDVIRIVFFVAILIVAVVAIIIIMNTLVISVIERTGEIGTMRALGAEKPFVWVMFLVETLIVTVVFGLVGIALASGLIAIVNLVQIPASSFFMQIIFGGKVLRMAIRPLSFLSMLVMVAAVGLVSHLYPVIVALKVPPVRAMRGE